MAINLETPKKFKPLVGQAHMVAEELLRPNSRKYDNFDHEYPVELDMLRALIDGMEDGAGQGAGAAGVGQADTLEAGRHGDNKNGTNLSTMLSIIEMCWGDCGLLLTMPGQGLGNSAIAAVANEEQLKRFKGKWAAMAITEPEAGSDSAAIRTTAVKDGDDYILNGEKIYVTSGERADLVVVWANVDPSAGRAGIKSFVVERRNPGMKLDRLEHKLGIRASDTAAFILQDCRVHKDNLLGDPEVAPTRASAASCRRSTTPARWSPRWRSASPAPRSTSCACCSKSPVSRSTTTSPRPTSPAPWPSSSSSRPTGRQRCC